MRPFDTDCALWWADPADLLDRHDLLDPVERTRRDAMRRPADQARQGGGAVLLRLAVARWCGLDPTEVVVERACPDCDRPHGRPRLPGLGVYASISHSGDRVVVALTDVAPVGVDVEMISPLEMDDLARSVLGPDERAVDLPGFFTYWTRKESVVKATGDGLRVPLNQVLVTPPDRRPALLRYPGRDRIAASMLDLDAGDGYLAALTVLTPDPVTVTTTWYGDRAAVRS